jgi:hypothetical protein
MTVTETDLRKAAKRLAKMRSDVEASYAHLVEMIQEANAQEDALSYDRISRSTELSKTQVQRICGA